MDKGIGQLAASRGHIMHRGNNRQNIFVSEKDLIRIKEDIEHSLLKSDCSLHAYVIMTNHLHLKDV